jgi:hypothetical protein
MLAHLRNETDILCNDLLSGLFVLDIANQGSQTKGAALHFVCTHVIVLLLLTKTADVRLEDISIVYFFYKHIYNSARFWAFSGNILCFGICGTWKHTFYLQNLLPL